MPQAKQTTQLTARQQAAKGFPNGLRSSQTASQYNDTGCHQRLLAVCFTSAELL